MLRHLLVFLAGTATAVFNESCNALDLAVVCENDCNVILNECIGNSGGNYDQMHQCLREHEACFSYCPCHLECPHGCPCVIDDNNNIVDHPYTEKKYECELNCTETYYKEAEICMDDCHTRACACMFNCEVFGYHCTEECGMEAKACHDACPCGPLCPNGCPCDNFCNEAYNQTTLVMSNSPDVQPARLLKWVVTEQDMEIEDFDRRGPAMDGLSGCQAVYNGNLFVLGGDGSNTVWRVSDCGLVEAQWSLPTEWENPGDKEDVAELEWNGGHVCQNANHLKEEDKDGLMICGPSSRTKVCLFFTQDEDGNFDWRNYPETPEGHNRGALADNRYQVRTYMIGGVNDDGNSHGVMHTFFPTFDVNNDYTTVGEVNNPYLTGVTDLTMVAYRRYMIVMGGWMNGKAYDGVHIFHEITNEWDIDPATQQSVQWKLLQPRTKLRAIVFDDRTLNVYGGTYGSGEKVTFIERFVNQADLNDELGQQVFPDFSQPEQSESVSLDSYDNPIVFKTLNTFFGECNGTVIETTETPGTEAWTTEEIWSTVDSTEEVWTTEEVFTTEEPEEPEI
ncbi:Oidioi.mRNA.OKI2018_I69.PAR.g9481.t1.cds [Oikopleura dioica]|uniref:Oidioi.mRNA.OKI2018_I69.PAR.g9481.t1.cds n=1 Tax=Oikopleura dioica TaxID=34765 RepID=A0ABN7RNL9_OIKDI|nr:Oidioi.mRNA.OKI2018_I69.PAR.g9481.t1.cds [Oikopleura dioica]